MRPGCISENVKQYLTNRGSACGGPGEDGPGGDKGDKDGNDKKGKKGDDP